jgi:hypothetical protein
MISRDPEATQRALDARREALRAEARHKVAREAANLLIQADARYRDARETTDTERAARLRAEGDERLKDLKRIDVAAWPWARLAERAREVEMIVASAASAPVFEGLRVGRGKPGAVRYHEFGRVLRGDGERRIGRRAHGFPVWELLGDEALRALDLQPSDVEAGAGWPDEDEAELQNVLESHIDGVLRERVATYEDLELARRERCVAHPLVAARREAGPRGPRPLDRRAGLPADGRRRTDPRVGPEASRRRAARADPRRLAAIPRARARQRAQVRRAARGGRGVLGPQVPAGSARHAGRGRDRSGRRSGRRRRRSLVHQPRPAAGRGLANPPRPRQQARPRGRHAGGGRSAGARQPPAPARRDDRRAVHGGRRQGRV